MENSLQKHLEIIRNEIRKRGFMSLSQAKAEMRERNFKEEADLVTMLKCQDIKEVEYTNSYLNGIAKRKLYYYIPLQKKVKI